MITQKGPLARWQRACIHEFIRSLDSHLILHAFKVLLGNLQLLHGLVIIYAMKFSKFDEIPVNEKGKLNISLSN